MRRALIASSLFASAVSGATVALAHGGYDWIRQGNYRNQSGEACCGRDDCSIVPHERVRAGADGFVLLGRRMSVKRSIALTSEDGRFWLCAYPDGRVRCFFVPPEM